MYNAAVQKRYALPVFNQTNTLALLIGVFAYLSSLLGNSRHLWRPFIQYLADIGYQCDSNPNPLDSFPFDI